MQARTLHARLSSTFGDATLSEISGDIPCSASSLPLPRPLSPSPDACSAYTMLYACIRTGSTLSHFFTMSYVIAGRAIKVSASADP